jgi:transcription-repair coupling factor (superfamily II helicase)
MWATARKRVGEAVKDMAAELLRIQAARKSSPGRSFPSGTSMQVQFADEFPYTETPDQVEAVRQIDADTAAPRPMDRLVCGDVGYGKTELAMRAALKVAEEGAQTAVLVPTTLLAEQHYRTFSERFADYPVMVEMLCRLRTASQQKRVVERLRLGQVDVVIGTHRLLSRDIEFADLGLVVIDEEQRFGVAAKEHLKSLRTSVDVLTLTATPIPRTLHMAMLGLRDISSLQTPPMDRRAIHTEVVAPHDSLIRAAIMRELNRGGQVFFLHNRVRGIDRAARRIQTLARGATVAIAHGRMGRAELEEVMMRFVAREIDILVTTTIIESGLDIPSANTMIIHDADRFGLSELHQLRGRVGRYIHRAYCYLLLPETRSVSPTAARRLKAIEDFSDLGAGFQIAMRDLEIRGAGNILGAEQSGHIAAVGYELYCSLLADAACRLRGQEPQKRVEVHVELGVEAYIPRNYVPSDRQRMELYRRLAACSTAGAVDSLREDIVDACGPIPAQAGILIDIMELRIRLARLDVNSAVLMEPDVVFKGGKPQLTRGALCDAPGTVRPTGDGSVYWRPPAQIRRPEMVLRELLGQLRNI